MDSQPRDYDTTRFTRTDRPPMRARQGRPKTGEHLGTCPRCVSRLVQPVEAVRCHDSCWHVVRHCPECDWRGAGYFAAEDYAAYRDDLEAARLSLEELLFEIERGRREAEVRRFSRSLDLGQISPDDF